MVNTSLKNLPGPSEQPDTEQNLPMKVHYLEVADASLHTLCFRMKPALVSHRWWACSPPWTTEPRRPEETLQGVHILSCEMDWKCAQRKMSKRLCVNVSVEKPSVLPWVIKEGSLERVGKEGHSEWRQGMREDPEATAQHVSGIQQWCILGQQQITWESRWREGSGCEVEPLNCWLWRRRRLSFRMKPEMSCQQLWRNRKEG